MILNSLGLVILTATAIAGGQALLAVVARSLPAPSVKFQFLWALLGTPLLYAAIMCYAVSVISYFTLLQRHQIVSVNVPIILIILALNAILGYLLGERMTSYQWIGLIFAATGVFLLREGW